jgi:chromosome segregation ATPase
LLNHPRRTDYLQALSDENKISVEKIGSGNWYWSFASEDKKTRDHALAEAQSAHEKAATVINDLKAKLAEAQAQREDEADTVENGGKSREQLLASKAELDKEVKGLQKELAAYSDTDPTELERKKKGIEVFKGEAEQFTDEIYAMEGWFKKMGLDEAAMKNLRMMLYGDEVDEKEGVLKELM